MGIYIIEDDDTMIEILEDLIEDHEMGEVVGSSTDPSEALLKVPARGPAGAGTERGRMHRKVHYGVPGLFQGYDRKSL